MGDEYFKDGPFDEPPERARMRGHHSRLSSEVFPPETGAMDRLTAVEARVESLLPLGPLAMFFRALTTLKALGWGGIIGGGAIAFSPELRNKIIELILGLLS